MRRVDLTIAIPTLNRRRLLGRAVESALRQDVPVEIIISDNGSNDDTDAFLKTVESDHLQIRKFRINETISAQKHGTFIQSHVQTDWLVMLHDDDYLEPDFSRNVLSIISDNPNIALVYTGCNILYGDVTVGSKTGPCFEDSGEFLLEFMRGNRDICMCATAYRMADLKRFGPQPGDVIIGDMFYWTRILAMPGVVGCAPGRHATYRMYEAAHSSETSRTRATKWIEESRSLARAMQDAILARGRAEFPAVRAAKQRYLALTSANHLIWTCLKGARRIDLARDLIDNLDAIAGNPQALARALGAILLPRSILEAIVLRAAQARERANRAVADAAP